MRRSPEAWIVSSRARCSGDSMASRVCVSASPKALVDQAKAAGAAGEQADGYVGVRTSVDGDTQAAISATNAGRRQAYARSAADAGTTAEVAGARMFETQLLPRISSGQWYKNAQGQWVQR